MAWQWHKAPDPFDFSEGESWLNWFRILTVRTVSNINSEETEINTLTTGDQAENILNSLKLNAEQL